MNEAIVKPRYSDVKKLVKIKRGEASPGIYRRFVATKGYYNNAHVIVQILQGLGASAAAKSTRLHINKR
jgi:hypothetical protein